MIDQRRLSRTGRPGSHRRSGRRPAVELEQCGIVGAERQVERRVEARQGAAGVFQVDAPTGSYVDGTRVGENPAEPGRFATE